MSFKKLLLSSSLFISFLLCTTNVDAARFSEMFVRLDRVKANTSTTGVVCAKPATVGVENDVQVTFPQGFSVSTTLSNWTTNTSDLPAGATAWTGIGTATSVSGQSVTFPSGELIVGTLYCFNWSQNSALTTNATGDSKNGTLTTRTGGGSTIDSSAYAVAVTPQDQISITATIEPLSSGVDFSLSGSKGNNSTLREKEEVTFTVSYRSGLSTSYPFEIVASWEKGQIEGNSANQIDIFEYVIGSATAAHDGSPAVVDLQNRRITWTIASLAPSSTAHTVSFKLKVRDELPTDKEVNVKVKAQGKISNSYLPEEVLNYKVQKAPLSAPTSTPAPTPTPAPGVTPIEPLEFLFVRIRDISSTTAEIVFATNRATTYTLLYGESPHALNQTIRGLSPRDIHEVKLANLTPDTSYYFKIIAEDEEGNSITSDIFTFRTASDKEVFHIKKEDIVFFWKRLFLSAEETDILVVPKNKPIAASIAVEQAETISQITALFQNSSVLGIKSDEPPTLIEETQLVEILPGFFSGELLTPQKIGVYEIVLEINTVGGGYHTVTLPYRMHISEPVRVLDRKNNQPIENATIKILKYEQSLKRFTPLEKGFGLIYYTDAKGELDIVLPSGTYLFEYSALGYAPSETKVELGISDMHYPQIYMNPRFSLIETVSYHLYALNDAGEFTARTAGTFFSSKRAKDTITLLFILLLAVFFLSHRLLRHFHKGSMTFLVWLESILYTTFLDTFALMTLIFTILFLVHLGLWQVIPLLVVTLVVVGVWLAYVRELWLLQR